MRIDAEKLLSEADIVAVIDRHVQLEKRGSEFYGICPFHDDHHTSLQVNPRKQIYKCFACGAGGDAIDFLTRMGRTFHEACEELNGGKLEAETNPQQRAAAAPKQPTWKQIKPSGPVQSAITHYRHGVASMVWTYRDETGDVLGYVCRFDVPGGKEVLPYVYATDGNRSEWRWLGFDKPRPLYNRNLIQQHLNATIVLVEGEKAADAVSAQVDPSQFVATTWIGGANGIDNADFGPITGRRVILWADNDEPGRKAMIDVAKKLKGEVLAMSLPKGLPEKWDAADHQWQAGELVEFLNLAKPYGKNPEAPAPKNPFMVIGTLERKKEINYLFIM
jgi:DNA primase